MIWCLLANSDDYLVPVIVPSFGSSYNQSPVLSSFCWGSEEWKTEDKQSSQHDSLYLWRIDTQSAAYYKWMRHANETLSCYHSLMITSWVEPSLSRRPLPCHAAAPLKMLVFTTELSTKLNNVGASVRLKRGERGKRFWAVRMFYFPFCSF